MAIGVYVLYVSMKYMTLDCPASGPIGVGGPRTFQEEMKNPPKPSEIFANMFASSAPYVRTSKTGTSTST